MSDRPSPEYTVVREELPPMSDGMEVFRFRVRDGAGALMKGRFHTEQQALDWIDGHREREVLGLSNRAESERDTGGRWDPRWDWLAGRLNGRAWDPVGDQWRADQADGERLRQQRIAEGAGDA